MFNSRTRRRRIPTDRGYRFYVDLLLESKRSTRTASAVEAGCGATGRPPPDSLPSQASHVVRQASRLFAFALKPAQGGAVSTASTILSARAACWW
jgi:transcriptional regulator of heat shock response